MTLSIDQARLQQNDYRPNDAVMAQNRQIILLPFVGATAVGKNYLMQASGYHIVGTTLTREPRPDDDPAKYTYLTNDALLKKIEDHHVVQYGVSPTAPTIYSSLASDYDPTRPNVMDCFYDAVEGLQAQGYQKVLTVSIFTPAEQWREQMVLRYRDETPVKVRSRLDEAEQSIVWSLARHNDSHGDHLLLLNAADNLAANVQSIHAFVDEQPYTVISKEKAAVIARDMQRVIAEVRSRLDSHA